MSQGAREPTLVARRRLEARREARRPRRSDGHFLPELAWAGLARAGLRLSGLHGRGRRNLERFRFTENVVELRRLPPAFDGLRVLHLSDLHLDVYPTFAEAVGRALAPLAFDVCVLTGDYRYRKAGPTEPAMDALARLRPFLGGEVLAILGNHDHSSMVPALEAQAIRVLVNETVPLARGGDTLHVVGVDDPHLYRTDDLEGALDGTAKDGFRLLLAHAPEIAERARRRGIDLLLAGHTHGGQIAWPGGRPIVTNTRAPRKLAGGPWRWGELLGYTSRGTGSSFADVRLNCPPEIVVHVLRCGAPTAARSASDGRPQPGS